MIAALLFVTALAADPGLAPSAAPTNVASPVADTDLRAWAAPSVINECIAGAVLPRERVLRDYALELVHVLAPQVDRRDLRRVLDGNQVADWPSPPTWQSLTQTITS